MNPRSKIVQDGLVLHLDAALSNSYSGSGNKWYDLTTNHYDASLINSPTYYPGYTPCLNFDGNIQHADLGKILNYTTGNFTFNYWAFFNDFSTNNPVQSGAPVFYKGEYRVNGYYDYVGSIDTYTGFINFTTSQSGANQSSSTDTSICVLKVKTWHNICITRDVSTVTIYVDGIDRTYTHGNHINPASSTDNFTLAVYEYNGYNLRSDVRIAKFMNYNRALSPEEIWQNYNATSARFKFIRPMKIGNSITMNIFNERPKLMSGLVAYWKLEGSLGYAKDEIGNNDGTLSNILQDQSGIIGTSVEFDGCTNSYIVFSDATSQNWDFQQNQDFSIFMWLNKLGPGNVPSLEKVLGHGASSSGSIGWNFGFTSGMNLMFQIGNGVSRISNSANVSSIFTDYDQWHNVVFVAERTKNGAFYVDGIGPLGSFNISTHNITLATDRNYMGTWASTSSYTFKGRLSNVGFWHRLLTPSEIKWLYREGQGCQFPFNY